MQHAIVALTSATTPTPTPTIEVDPDLVTPGVWGFVITALVAVAVIFLVWDMMRRIRRGRVRADIQEQLDAEEQAARAASATEVDDESIDPDDEPGRRGGTPPRG
ncbi:MULTISPECIES: hypothetical protein [Microbacterium]|uniref:hypothetical protein n=1 Tax=Microbacterium TaxID=33882 RepID=UPI000D650330|nr:MULTISPECIES: hypothetical protein [Microbacterium]